MRRFAAVCSILVLGFALGRTTTPTAVAQDTRPTRDIEGSWSLEGWDMGAPLTDAPAYDGSVELEHRGDDTYTIDWFVGDRRVNSGVGLYDPRTDTFVAGYEVRGAVGVAVWEITDGGDTMICVGTFESRLGETAHERWRR